MIGKGRDLSIEREILRLDVRSTQGARLDRYLVENLPWRSRNRIQGLIRDAVVTVNGRPAKPSQRVRAGDVIELRLSNGTGVPADYGDRELEILYEDPWLVAVNKPPGLLVHPVGRHVYDTLMNYLHHRYHDAGAADSDEAVVPRLCHRLDRDTTGVVVVAKTSWVHRQVMGQFENREVSKSYLAIVQGVFPEETRVIDIPIGDGRSLQAALAADGLKESLTLVRVVERLRGHTLMRCEPHTGRQNQIRIHLAAIGHPILGDFRYGATSSRSHRAPSARYYLHSAGVRFYHPRLKVRIELEAPIPDDFREAVEILGCPESAELDMQGCPTRPADGSWSTTA